MAINPAQTGTALNDPVTRASELNDPKFNNSQGYFPYNLTHQELITPRFGEISPSMYLHTAPADRHVVKDNIKTLHTQINGNFLSQINQYVDTFYIPLRAVFPTNYEKLIPNPTKGDDLPNMALPQFALKAFVNSYLRDASKPLIVANSNYGTYMHMYELIISNNSIEPLLEPFKIYFSRVLLLATVFSRGQLLDYLGVCLDVSNITVKSELQTSIDNLYAAFYSICFGKRLEILEPDLLSDALPDTSVTSIEVNDLSQFRNILSDAFERGQMVRYDFTVEDYDDIKPFLVSFMANIFTALNSSSYSGISPDSINNSDNPFNEGFINLEKVLGYQLAVAQYFTNNSVDNIFTADLYMQALRAVMFPSDGVYSKEPTFTYNGVTTEYDYISCGGTYYSLIDGSLAGSQNRQYVWLTMLMLMRRSLRYGDYFSTARPNMLAVGQLEINVVDGKVSPIDVTQNLLKQRYLNAANYVGSGFLEQYASFYGVTPSDTPTFPRFIAHRTIPLQSDVVTNTATEQGKQVTNLVGYSDGQAFDVFIDDFGVIISVVSYDVLPVYKSGIDNTYHFSDRFDYFNPMLQGIGDQPIRVSEIVGTMRARESVFGYTMRNAEYKYKISRAHGAFVNNLPGFMLSYPVYAFASTADGFHIDPDFIRDKPMYMDSVVTQQTGYSPAEYYHFIVSCTNEVQSARKIQATPPVLF